MNELTQTAIRCLDTSAFVYLAACLTYIVAVARSTRGGGGWAKAGAFFVFLGFLLHTAGLGLRWYIGGIGRPPWTNLYESLVFFAWGVVAFQVYAQFKWKLPLVGAISSPLILILMGMSVMTPNKSVEPLIPALQSNWLKIHVVFGMLAYAGFTLSACFAFLHLMRNGVSLSRIGAGLAVMTMLNLGIAGGTEVFTKDGFYMAKTTVREMPDGTKVKVKDTSMVDGKPVTQMEKVPGAAVPFWLSIGLFAAAACVLWVKRSKTSPGTSSEVPETAEEANRRGYDLQGAGIWIFRAASLGMLGLFGTIGAGLHASETLTLASNPYLVMLLGMTSVFLVVYLLVTTRYVSFLSSLPKAERLDELGYKLILFGFPFQTLLLITGAIWAYSAWGRSWGWDPKETWALITWFAYLIYLHGKLLMRWRPSFLSVWSIAGFVILIFAFLGVNLVLSGLHSYGAA